MKARDYTQFGRMFTVAGIASTGASLALWLAGELTGSRKLQHAGLFVGLWTPSLLVMANRLAIAGLTHSEHQRFIGNDEEGELHVEGTLKLEPEEEVQTPVQSPRPLSHVRQY
ncbi:MAG TPA: hypothetical protein V6D47_11940 [Oscillatoriaceae cyanobacterium]